jgi:hypothetical protein
MKNMVIGVVIGLFIGGGIAFAASRGVLQNGNGVEVGTASNPLVIQTN